MIHHFGWNSELLKNELFEKLMFSNVQQICIPPNVNDKNFDQVLTLVKYMIHINLRIQKFNFKHISKMLLDTYQRRVTQTIQNKNKIRDLFNMMIEGNTNQDEHFWDDFEQFRLEH